MVLTETDKIDTSNVKSPTGSSRKRKRRSIAGLAKVINLSTSFPIDILCRYLVNSNLYAIYESASILSFHTTPQRSDVILEPCSMQLGRLCFYWLPMICFFLRSSILFFLSFTFYHSQFPKRCDYQVFAHNKSDCDCQ